jgi:hypothetical protein
MSTITVLIPDPALNEVLHTACHVPLETDLTSDDLASLTLLDASSMEIANLEGMQYCVNLLTLDLSSNEMDDLTPIIGLTSLTSLYINENFNLKNEAIQTIATLINLVNLSVAYNEHVSLDFTSNMNKLSSLNSRYSSLLYDLKGLSYLPSLYELILNNCSHIRDISPLSTLPSLSTLILYEDKAISNFEVIGEITTLTDLSLNYCALDNISFVKTLINLETLSLIGNFVFDITPLVNMEYLVDLNIPDNNVSDLSTLINLKNLTTLVATRNRISSLASLFELPQLQVCNVGENYLTDMGQVNYLRSKFIRVLFDDNFIVGQPNQNAFHHASEINLPAGTPQTKAFQLYKSTLDGTYVPNTNTYNTDLECYIAQSTDAGIFVTTGKANFTDDETLFMNTEMTGINPGEAYLQIMFKTVNQTPVKLPFTTGDYQFNVSVTPN